MRLSSSIAFIVLAIVLVSCASAAPSTQATSSPTVYINEILAHTDLPQIDAIELFNPASTALDIGGWFLSDKKSEPQRVRLPRDTIVPANGYLVIDENIMRSGANGFALSEEGETVYLSAANSAGELTGFVTKADFSASPNGISFGRIDTNYVLLTHPTLGQPNADPQIGPIVIQEVFASNSLTRTQYILFENITSQTVPLYDPQNPDNVWRIRKTVDFDFPPFTTIAPQEQFIVAAAPAALAAQTNLRILGSFSDRLNPAGSTIELLRPGAPNADKVPYITIDFIEFSSVAPWPTTTQSLALRRIALSKYGNDASNWEAGFPMQK